MIKRSHIRQFLAIVDAGSFTEAARRIRVTQPALSVGIAQLEEIVRQKLFERNRRQVRLTEAGGLFLPIARELEAGFRRADEFGREHRAEWPVLKLGTIPTISSTLLQQVLASLPENITLEIIEGNDAQLRAGLVSGRIQAAVTTLREHEGPPFAHSLFREPYVMLGPKNHPFAGRDHVEPEEYASEIMIARRSCELLDATSRFFSKRGVRPRFAFRSESDERCIRLVAAGLGITTAPISLAVKGTTSLSVNGYDFFRRIGVLLAPDLASDAEWHARFQRVAQQISQ